MKTLKTKTENRVLQFNTGFDKVRKYFYVSASVGTIEGPFISSSMSEMGNARLVLAQAGRDSAKRRQDWEDNWQKYPEIVNYLQGIARKYNLELV